MSCYNVTRVAMRREASQEIQTCELSGWSGAGCAGSINGCFRQPDRYFDRMGIPIQPGLSDEKAAPHIGNQLEMPPDLPEVQRVMRVVL